MRRQQSGLACEECRRRKARCDRVRPQCGICTDAGRTCIVVDKRSPRGPKKGQLKDLRYRLGEWVTTAVIEQQLINQNQPLDSHILPDSNRGSLEREASNELHCEGGMIGCDTDELQMLNFASSENISVSDGQEAIDWTMAYDCRNERSSTWNNLDMSNPRPCLITPISPVQTSAREMAPKGELDMSDLMQADLDLLYFERVHPIVPMIHKRRYLSWANEKTVSPARACLRSAMRTIAAAMSAQFCAFSDKLYACTRSMLEMQDVQGENGLPWMTTTRASRRRIEREMIQAWLLLAHCEFLRKPEQDALLASTRAFRLLQLSRLFDIDIHDDETSPNENSGSCPSVSPSTTQNPPDEAWIETEEKRRTLWTAFVLDCLSSMLSDRPSMLHEDMINTRLPMPERDFQSGQRPVPMGFLPETMGKTSECETLSSFARCVVFANLFGRCIAHRRLAQSVSLPESGSESKSRHFWMRHEWLAAAAAHATRPIPPTQAPNESKSETAKCDPLAAFNRILAYSACISLSETAEARAWETLDDHTLALSYRQVASQAAYEIALLIQKAPRIAFFKMHPMLPNAIYLAAKFLRATTPNFATPAAHDHNSIHHLLVALGYLSNVNNLARDLLVKAKADIGENALIATEVTGPNWDALKLAIHLDV
ncbi:hypothetical protein N7499_006962 [Penicillium canescens]|uniref:Zn(2)-C6 fungal-type domain-containing protein n=1 Tax=Penicillium canescens TaxID=5083 RepID=A0AAD6IFG8_PENCN|nr:uncharacterized protein N7446_002656 [Penicillium canescens]KAJ6044462.1 hypothetical protein N7460_005817 [Penicillium canescens]KAJ6055932.1 hypothetical protein N7444_005030 [Penicillium canescens]KAJ6074879.1 hypothetical protein N7446_002656 [Penicillium canescens]KAJ6082088.1 hypothetical protein N7499_006962 [Penicillium canescens]